MESKLSQPEEKPNSVTEAPKPEPKEEPKPEASGVTENSPEDEAPTSTIMTAAQKKAAKKEREKKKKEAAKKAKQQQKQPETEREELKEGTQLESIAAVTDAAVSEAKGQGSPAEEGEEVKSKPTEGAADEDGEEGEEEGDDKKKKKKKKKKAEEEKKSKVHIHMCTVSITAVPLVLGEGDNVYPQCMNSIVTLLQESLVYVHFRWKIDNSNGR